MVDYSLLPTAWIVDHDFWVIKTLSSPRIPKEDKDAVSMYETMRTIFPDLGDCFWLAFHQRYCELATGAEPALARRALAEHETQTRFLQSIQGLEVLSVATPPEDDEILYRFTHSSTREGGQ